MKYAITIDGFKERYLQDPNNGGPMLFDTEEEANEEIDLADRVGYVQKSDAEAVEYPRSNHGS